MTKQYLINEPELIKDWDFDENQDLNPTELLVGSNKKAAWICYLCGNKWITAIYHRAINKSGCRKCSSRQRLNFNIEESIFKTHPDIAKDWSPDKNGRLTAKMFSKNSRYEANWRCHICGVETTKSIKNYSGCKHCKKAKRLEKRNLELNFPEVSKEWDNERNGHRVPSDFKPASNKYAWWLCSTCGYSWSAKISNRTSLGRGCPLCSNTVVVTGKNDLATSHPYLAKEWHPTKNKQLTPEEVTYGNVVVWWLCPKGHEYDSKISSRIRKDKSRGCPYCSGKMVGEDNNLFSLFPKVSSEWHPTKNGSSRPEEFTSRSSKKVWWLCPKGHEYDSIIGSRTGKKPSGCPYCSSNKASEDNNLLFLFPKVSSEWHPSNQR